MSYADWGPPADDHTGPVVLVGDFEPGRYFVGCARVTEFDNGHDLDNEEQGTDLWLCEGPARPWADLWPDLRRFY